jgi:hypothetical protein
MELQEPAIATLAFACLLAAAWSLFVWTLPQAQPGTSVAACGAVLGGWSGAISGFICGAICGVGFALLFTWFGMGPIEMREEPFVGRY